jgi:hypothetical protein
MNTTYQPYTYLIGWTDQQKYYYGVRYAKNCSPGDFWTKYFTSSPAVLSMRLLHGDPDIRQIRKMFSNREQARQWETRVLTRMKVVVREDFLNKNNAPAPPINNRVMSADTKEKIGSSNRGKPKSEAHKQKIRVARAKQVNTRKGIPVSEETKQKIREARAKQITTDETRKKMSESRKGEKHWTYGKPRSEETKQKIREANLGKVLSEETKQKMRGPRLTLKDIE